MGLSPDQERDLVEKFRPIPPEKFARKALDAIAKNKAIIVLPSWWKPLWWSDRLSPSLMMLLNRKGSQVAG